jgi:glycolate oxidase FAD binding subunit
VETPATGAEAAKLLAEAAAAGRTVRARGGGTKWAWGGAAEPDVVLSTERLGGIEHVAGDLTAVLGAGVRLADAQAVFAEAGQRLALDPPLGPGEAATVGGVLAAGDSGPLRHRYGAARDLLLGATVALPDGTVAKAGSRVIKNVAGYDLAKLYAGSLGSLGVLVEAVVRLHPRPVATATLVGETGDPAALAHAVQALAAAPLELEALDVRWAGGSGAVLAQAGGTSAAERASAAGDLAGIDARVEEDDAALWSAQRDAQRPAEGELVRISGLLDELEATIRAVDAAGGSLVSRAGVTWASVPAGAEITGWRVHERWPEPAAPLARLAGRVKERFDPAGVLAPGVAAA